MNDMISDLPLTIFLCLLPATAWAQTPRASEAPHAEASAERSSIYFETVGPVKTVVRKIHEPYWRLGRRFEELQAYQEKHKLTGTMFLRFPENPIRAATGTPECEIGFILQQNHMARYPYRNATRKSELVVSMIVKKRPVNIRSDYPKVIEWALANGYQPTGPVMEVYRRRNGSFERVELATEIQLSVRKLSVNHSEDSAVAAGEKIELLGYRKPAPNRSRHDAKGRDKDHDTISALKNTESRTIRELADAGDFDALAEALLPDDARVPESRQVWLGHIVFRVRALADGAKRIGTDDATLITAISDALSKRYDAVSDTFASDPLKSPVAYGMGPKDRVARAIMQKLDTLLGRVAFGLSPSAHIFRELTDILNRVKIFLWS